MLEYPGSFKFHEFRDAGSQLTRANSVARGLDLPGRGMSACPLRQSLPGRSPVVEAPPQQCGIDQLVATIGPNTSVSHLTRHDDVAAGPADRAWFAPGEEPCELSWLLTEPGVIESAKLTVSCKAFNRPIHTQLLSKEEAAQLSFSWDGTIEPSTPEMDGAFPDKVVTVEHSPYKLSLELTGPCKPGFERAFTYVDVLVHSITLQWGTAEQIPNAPRDDVHARHQAETARLEKTVVFPSLVQQQADPSAGRVEVILDADVLEGASVTAVLVKERVSLNFLSKTRGHATVSLAEAMGEDVTFPAGTDLPAMEGEAVFATGQPVTFAAGTTGPQQVEVTRSQAKAEKAVTASKVVVASKSIFKAYQDHWGDGPRIPIIAHATVRKSDGSAAGVEASKKALGRAAFLWDWDEGEDSDKLKDWLGEDQTTFSTLSRDFLNKTLMTAPSDAHSPSGCNNCPTSYGGKRGANGRPVFLPSEGTGAFPYKVVTAGKRLFDGISFGGTGEQAGTTGVLFQPSRMPGDRYRLRVIAAHEKAGARHLIDVEDGLDGVLAKRLEALPDTARPPLATTGVFEVYRRSKLKYYTFPANAPGGDQIDPVLEDYKKSTGVILEITKENALPPNFKSPERWKEAYDEMVEGNAADQFLISKVVIDPQLPPGQGNVVHVRDAAEYATALEDAFKNRPITAMSYSGDLPASDDRIHYLEVADGGAAQGWIVHTGSDSKGKPLLFVLSKNDTPFSASGTLTAKNKEKTTLKVKTVSEASGWIGRRVTINGTGDNPRRVEVTLGNQNVVLTYSKVKLSSRIAKSIGKSDKKALLRALKQAVQTSQPGTPLPISIKGFTGDGDGVLRLAEVEDTIHRAFTSYQLVDRMEIYNAFLHHGPNYLLPREYEAKFKKIVDGTVDVLMKKFGKIDCKDQPGIFCFFFQQLSKLSFFVHGGANVGESFGSRPDMLTAQIVFPQAPVLTPKQAYIPIKSLLAHELAHTLGIDHAPKRLFDQAPVSIGDMTKAHVEWDTCVMNYDPDLSPGSTSFCALCILKLRAWNIEDISNKVDYDAATKALKADIGRAGPNKPWAHVRLAHHLSEGGPVKAAQSKLCSDSEAKRWDLINEGRRSEPLASIRRRYSELDSKKKDGELSKPEKSEWSSLYQRKKELDDELTDRAALAAAPMMIEAKELRSAALELTAQIEEAAAGLNALPEGLKVILLRNLVLVHCKYGDVPRARTLYEQLKALSEHDHDLTGGNVRTDINNNSPMHHIADRQDLKCTLYRVMVGVEPEDVDLLFTDTADSARGKKARLQAMGLFNYPLDRADCADPDAFAWSHALSLLPDIANPLELHRAILKYLVDDENGMLPASGAFAKLRLPGGFQPRYSTHELNLQFPEWDYPKADGWQEGKKEEEQPFVRLSLYGADQYRVENDCFHDNPALGKIPLTLGVQQRPLASAQDAWQPVPNARLYVQLVAPDALPPYAAGDYGAAETPVAGGASFIKQGVVTSPPLSGAANTYLSERLGDLEGTGENDPQAGNAHFQVGGKRELNDFGNVRENVTHGDVTFENIFCKQNGRGAFQALPNLDDSEQLPHTVSLDTDGQGIAKLVFSPSRIGGDAYKLRFFLGQPSHQERTGFSETGTMVRWRTIRICRYLQVGVPAGVDELPEHYRALAQGDNPPAALTTPAQLETLDFSGDATNEFAKAYCEVIVEPRARAAEAFDDAENGYFRTQLNEHVGRYPWFEGCTLWGNVSIQVDTLARDPLDDTNTRFKATLSSRKPFLSSLRVELKGSEGKDNASVRHSNNKPDQMVGTVQLDTVVSPAQTASFNYATGELLVVFDTPQAPEKTYPIKYHAAEFLDFDALFLPLAAKSPFLFNLRLPASYNQEVERKKPGFYRLMQPEDASYFKYSERNEQAPIHFAYIDDGLSGAVKCTAMNVLARSVGNNKGYYPGVVFVKSAGLDTYTAFGATGTQEGKGVGNAVFLLSTTDQRRIAIHEMGHTLFKNHSHKGPFMHLHDNDAQCVMSYNPAAMTFCGHCVAFLRGMSAAREPFVEAERELR